MSNKRQAFSYFIQFSLFNLCFFCLQLLYTYAHSGNFISLIPLPWAVYGELLSAIILQLLLYVPLSLLQTILLIGVLKRSSPVFSEQQWQLLIWFLTAFTLIIANAYYFPLSLFGKIFSLSVPKPLLLVLLSIFVILLGLLLINSLLSKPGLFVLVITSPMIYLLGQQTDHRQNQSAPTRPNIIILGIDSLSSQSVTSKNMPLLAEILRKSQQFTQTISPLARTYPAWCSILTGMYVKHHHAEENLIAKNQVNSQASIAWLLREQGYYTLFATDDRRFNNLDQEFGFQHIVGPKLGVTEIILGTYNDFPLGNLFINFSLTARWFPYNYSNRASFFSYYPQTFNTLVEQSLIKESPKQPLFLAVHFTLPHWPYAWAESSAQQVDNEFSLENRDVLYQSALAKVDHQFASLYSFLQQHHYLDNSLIIILSDHGETLYTANSRLTNKKNYQGTAPSVLANYFKRKTATVLNKSAGHGSDILSPNQYQSILAWQIYQKGKLISPQQQISTRVALIDIAPSILSFLNLSIPHTMDGISLLQANLPQRSFFIESGMFPNQEISKEKAMSIGKDFYHVNTKTHELELNARQLNTIKNQKLYGIIKGDWVLALYPDDTHYIPVIQNLVSNEWTDDLNSAFAKSAQAEHLKQGLQAFYGSRLSLPIQ
ncbi:MAG: DUF229 domain-containing protein [Legionella sp.]|nr:MAG: DUF229 domain-containing protein [Legionella sp.]